jgi:hypothetical protein
MKEAIVALVWQIFMWVISLVLLPLALLLGVIDFLRRRDSEQVQRVGVGAVAGGLSQLLLVQTYPGIMELLRGMLVGTIVGALLVIAIEWLSYFVEAILAVLYWMLRWRPGAARSRDPKLELVIWGAVVGALVAAVSAERNQAQIEFVWALAGGGIIGATVGAIGQYLKRLRQ